MMPSESTSPLSEEYRAQLDQFIHTNYLKLRKYAIHKMKGDNNQGDELLNTMIVSLYEGKRTLDFSKHPLSYFQRLLLNTKFNGLRNRQRAHEEGYSITRTPETIEVVYFSEQREGQTGPQSRYRLRQIPRRYQVQSIKEHAIASDILSYTSNIDDQIDKQHLYKLYSEWKATRSPYRQWILEQMEQGMTPREIYEHRHLSPLGTKGEIKFQTMKMEVCRLKRYIKALTHLQDVPSDDLGHR